MLCILEDFLPQLDHYVSEHEAHLDFTSLLSQKEGRDSNDSSAEREKPEARQQNAPTGSEVDEDYVRALEMYCLLKQRLLDIKHNWKTVVQEAFTGHGRHTGNLWCICVLLVLLQPQPKNAIS